MGSSCWNGRDIPKFERLSGDKKTEVLIIGGGMAGLLCAYWLEKAGVDYMLCEADRICSGITKNTTAKISSQHGLIYAKLVREFGVDKAKLYLEANEEAVREYRRICENIDCGFENKDSFVYSRNSLREIENELAAIAKLGYRAEFCDSLSLPFKVEGAVKFHNQAQFDPLKFVANISRGLNIFEHTKIKELIGNTAITDRGKIEAEKIIVTTHFPFINKHGCYFVKMYQHRSYVIALEGAEDVNGIYVDASQNGLSFRNYGKYLLLGGGSHRTGKKGGCWQELEDLARKYYPHSQIKYRFATQDCMSLDGVPYIGQYSKNTPNMFVATGFNKWGMSSSMVAGKLLSDMVLGKENKYATVFDPSRTILRAQLGANLFETAVNFATPTTKRCPHLGCALKWNAQERSWDCPCHGSRFNEHGQLIDNPATDDI
ncbi:MAG: FAD-dependent oxidoreductase [Ruminococcaceae bacterium]|nr:FAD-dependent oxidoreductase [Oscillospiraceae bacterium]